MKTEIRIVTPEEAKRLIGARNPRYTQHQKASSRQWHVNEFAKSLRNGTFMLTHQGIAIDESGQLIDGFHRLTAIAQTGIPAKLVVCTGVESQTAPVIDRGQRRNAASVLQVDRRVAEVVGYIGKILTGTRVLEHELIAINAVFGSTCAALIQHCGTHTRALSAAPIKAAAVIATMTGSAVAFNRYEALVEMKPESDPSVMVLLRSLIDETDHTSRLIRAWIGFSRDVVPSRIAVKRKDTYVGEIREIVRGLMDRHKPDWRNVVATECATPAAE